LRQNLFRSTLFSDQSNTFCVNMSDEIVLNDQEKREERDIKRSRVLVLWFVAGGTVALLLYSTGAAPSFRGFLLLFAVLMLEAAAGFAAGALAGFLFGLPRTLRGPGQDQQPLTPKQTGKTETTSRQPEKTRTEPPEKSRSDRGYGANTNLEEISDWLTKIIVGFGLINLQKIPDKLRRVAAYFSSLSSCVPGCVAIPDSVSLAILVYFAACGFFLAYLLARLMLPAALRRAESPAEQMAAEAQQRSQTAEETSTTAKAVAEEAVLKTEKVQANLLEQLSSDSFPLVLQARSLINKGGREGNEADLNKALELLDEAARLDPKYYAAYLEKGRALKRLSELKQDRQRLERALEAVNEALKLAPGDYYPAFYNAACYKALLGMPVAEVAKDLKKAIEINAKLKEVAATDPDLAPVRDKPEIQALLSS
jgi:tetratricopeptide (TPR) repeat protein